MSDFYKVLADRTPDTQYRDRLQFILDHGTLVKETPQGVGAITCFGTVPPMIFDLRNGVPLVTERKISFWPKAVAEIIAFINGARTIDEIESYGCDYWEEYRGKGTSLGLAPNDMGPGSYGPGFHDYETPRGDTLNQLQQVIDQIREHPSVRTHLVTPWKPYYTARGPNRKVIVAPCHGWLHFRVIDGKLHMRMDQRSADMPIGVPSNMIEYAALFLMICQVTGYEPGNYIHTFADAHIYEDQVEKVYKLLSRDSKPFPVMRLDPTITNLFDFRVEHFTIEEYEPNGHISFPYRP